VHNYTIKEGEMAKQAVKVLKEHHPIEKGCPPPHKGTVSCKARIEGRNPCPHHYPAPCNCEKPLVGIVDLDSDIFLQQFGQLVLNNIFNTAETVLDGGNTGQALSANSATSVVTICAGTGVTAAQHTDHTLQTETETIAGVMSSYTAGSSSGSFTITGTITAGALRAYTEVGVKLTSATFVFYMCHDVFSVLNVSSGGTLAVTYTLTFS
jgi:hypothetical protein